jgi:diguanylate cyclase (GGDEF)-like protein
MPNGASAWLEIFTYPILDRDRNVSHVIEYTRDITERKQQEEEKKQLIERLNRLSTTDSLTGLLNRRALTEMLQHEIERSARYHTDLSLVICDIDTFKKINDSHGHLAGDRALLAVTDVLQKTLRKSDIAGRYGGDEFMLILPETTIAGAKMLAEKVRLAVERLDIEAPGTNKRVKITLSIGATSCCDPLENIDTLVAIADTALYSSKESGRNKVTVVLR